MDVRCKIKISLRHIPAEYLSKWDTPIIDINTETELEDPDLIPTQEDLVLVYNYVTRNGSQPLVNLFYDAESMIINFFKKPPLLRLSLGTLAFHSLSKVDLSELIKEKRRTYFRRARKAFYHTDRKPSIDLVIAFQTMYAQARELGDQVLSHQFLKIAVEMMIQLKLDVDPDDSPWLSHLAPREKEERRRVFWNVYKQYAFMLSYLPEPVRFNLNGSKVKECSQVYDPYPVFFNDGESYPLVTKLEAELWNLIGTLRNHYTLPPKNTLDLLEYHKLHVYKYMLSVYALIPAEFRLHFEDPMVITSQDVAQIKAQISYVQGHLYQINFNIQSSISVFLRPILFLTALPSF
ncbi:hypothetical protein HDU79_008802 [Rhizoclosmatium sp. JEL0117]|nr:hypothetical protein HDU79_008802 [Rhizoclosmatium sp. JEL0117]